MIASSDAEKLAVQTVGQYLELCKAQTKDQIASALTKLCSVAAIQMSKECGGKLTFERVLETASLVRARERVYGDRRELD